MTESDPLVLPAALRRRRPSTGRELEAFVRDVLVQMGLPRRVARAVDIEAEVTGAHVRRLSLAASGIALPSLEDPPEEPMPDGRLTREPCRIDELDVRGSDLRWEKATIDVAAHLEGLSLVWVLRGGELVAIELDDTTGPGGEFVRGSVRVETELAPLVESIRLTLDRHTRREGVRVPKLHVRAWDLGSGTYRIYLDAGVRWKFLPLSAHVAMIVTLDEDLVARCTDIRISSLNPLSAVGLFFARRELARNITETPIALRELLGPDLTHLTINLAPRLRVEATFAPATDRE